MNAGSPSTSSKTTPWRRRVLLAATTAAGALLLWLLAATLHQWMTVAVPAAAPLQQPVVMFRDEGAAWPDSDGQAGPLPGLWAAATETSDLVLLRPGDRKLMDEPGGLPAPPDAHRVLGFAREEAGTLEQYATWQANGTIQSLADFYQAAAADRGFAALGDARPKDDTITLMWHRHDQVLVVRLSAAAPVGAQPLVQVLMWHRSPTAPEPPAPAR